MAFVDKLEGTMNIIDIVDNDRIDDDEKRARLLGFLLLEFPLAVRTDEELQRVINLCRNPHMDIGYIIETLRVWCANHSMALYTVNVFPSALENKNLALKGDGRA